jgi:DNA-binding NtrC family response regulator
MRDVYRRLARVAPLDVDVLLEGETGTGKDLAAEAIHRGSKRTGCLVAVNCAGLPRDLFEAELFGSERGAFTGAETRAGRFEEAAGGVARTTPFVSALTPIAVPHRDPGQTLKQACTDLLTRAECQWIEEALRQARTRDEAARQLGIDPKTLYRKMFDLGLK